MEPAVQKRRSSGHVLTLVREQPAPAPQPPRPRRRVRTVLKVVVALSVVLAALVATAYVVYEQLQDKAARKQYQRAARIAQLDTPVAYGRALRILEGLQRDRPGDARARLEQAEILAMLWGRFDRRDQTHKRASQALQRARARDAEADRLAAVKGLHLLYEGRFAEAARHAESAMLVHDKSARLGYVLGMSRYYLGDLTAAEATLKLASSQQASFLPVRVALARVERQRRRFEAASAHLEYVLARSTQHPEAQLEAQLLRQAQGKPVGRSTLHRLGRRVSSFPPLRAKVLLAQARRLRRADDIARARGLLQQAAQAAPADPEIGLALVRAQLGPGGDGRKAWALRDRVQNRAREFVLAPPVFAEAALSVGRPDEAMRFLRQPLKSLGGQQVRSRARVVRVRAAWELERPALAYGECDALWKQRAAKRSSREVVACLAHAARTRADRRLRARTEGLRGRSQKLARAFRHLVRRRYVQAVEQLTPLVRAREPSPDTLMLLAESLQRIHRPAAAIPFLERAVKLGARSVRTRLALAQGLVKADRASEASKLLDVLVKQKPVGPRTLLDLGRLALALERLETTRAIARRLGRLHPTSGHAPYLEGLVLLRGKRQRRQTRTQLEAALMREPGHLESTLALARLAFARGDLHGGRALYDRAHRLSHRAPEVILALARDYFEHNRIRAARKAYVRAALGFRLLGAHYRAAEVLAELGHRLSGIEHYRHRAVKRILRWALRLSSRPARAHLYMGRFFEARGRLDEALAAYRRATRHGPEIAEGFYHLGSLLLATRQDVTQAENALQRFLDLTRRPRGRKAHNARSWVLRIQKRRQYLERKK